MPVKVAKRSGRYRVVEASSGKIARSSGGKPRDGGGHVSKDKASRQARAINSNLH